MPEKLDSKRQLLIDRTAEALATDAQHAQQLLSIERHSSFRINHLKCNDKERLLASLALLGWNGEPCAWYKEGYSIVEGRDAVINSDEAKNGELFVQNQASWLPVLLLNPLPGERILDMCAAPGGKAAHIADITSNRSELWVNDSSRPRLYKLKSNFERLGVRASQICMYDAAKLASRLEQQSFDKILLDAPCSGEGLINIHKNRDLTYWSRAQIKRLQALQKKLIVNAWQLLKPGGTLIYSSCTMAPEENEAVVDYLLRRTTDCEVRPIELLPDNSVKPVQQWNGKIFDSRLSNTLRLAPSAYVEAFYVAKLTKVTSSA